MSKTTESMLKQALSLALDGQTVIVVGVNRKHSQQLMNATIYLPEYKAVTYAQAHTQNQEIGLWPKGQIRFRSIEDPDWDAHGKRFRGYPQSVPHLLVSMEEGK